MASPPAAPGGPTQVVVAFLDGRRLKGFVFGFSALRDHCTVFPSEKAHAGEGEMVKRSAEAYIVHHADFMAYEPFKNLGAK